MNQNQSLHYYVTQFLEQHNQELTNLYEFNLYPSNFYIIYRSWQDEIFIGEPNTLNKIIEISFVKIRQLDAELLRFQSIMNNDGMSEYIQNSWTFLQPSIIEFIKNVKVYIAIALINSVDVSLDYLIQNENIN